MVAAVSISHLQSRLVSLLEQVRTQRVEDAALRAEVLLAMNQLCSPGMLLGLWQTLETVGPREELLLVRLLRDMESALLERACGELLASSDALVRSVGYGVVALRSRLPGAALIAEAFAREPGIVLKRGGRRHLAPHSFVTCMLAGIREFKDPVLDEVAMDALRGFARGQNDLGIIATLLGDERAEVARLGFVTLCSRFMGKLHRFAYEDVVCGTPYTLNRPQRQWMLRALRLAPEVVEAIAEPGPTGVGDADFVRARISILRQFAGDGIGEQIDALLAGLTTLPSVQIERRLSALPATEAVAHNATRTRSIAFLFSALTDYRPGLASLVDGLSSDDDDSLEMATLEHLLEVSGVDGALNLATALLVHWHELSPDDPDEGPFWCWLDGLWSDDRHDQLGDAIDTALARPDETALYAARVLATLGAPLGQLLAALGSGHPVDLSEIAALLDDPRLMPAVRATLHDSERAVHPSSLVALSRAGLGDVLPSLRALARSSEEAAVRHAADLAHGMLAAERIARSHELFMALEQLGLYGADRELVQGPEATAQLGLSTAPDGARLLRVFFWLADSQLPAPVGTRPATGYAACASFLIDAAAARVHYAAWSDREGLTHELLELPEPPADCLRGFRGVPWGTPLEAIADAVAAVGGRSLATAPLQSNVATRSLVELGPDRARLETDARGRFVQAVFALPTRSLDDAVRSLRPSLGKPLFRTGSAAVWRYRELEIGVRPDPAFDTLAQYVRHISR